MPVKSTTLVFVGESGLALLYLTSKKVRSAKHNRALKGEHASGRTPYGYLKDPNDKHRLIIDEEVAPIVRRIFQMCADGLGTYQICTQLAQDKILTPSSLEFVRTGKFAAYYDPDYPWDWKTRTIDTILRNQMYLGHMVSHTQASKSFKSKKIIQIPRDEWIIVNDKHAPIISQELFDKVQKLVTIKKRANKQDLPNLFGGYIYCVDCGKCLTLHNNCRRNTPYYICSGYRTGTRTGDSRLCTTHTTKANELEALTLHLIQCAATAALDVDKFVEMLLATSETDDTERKALARLKKREAKLRILTKRVFEQNALGKIDDTTFADLYACYQSEQKDVTAQIEGIEKRQRDVKDRAANARLFAAEATKYIGATALTRNMITDLMDKIVAHQAEGERRERSQKIDFYFRFIGRLPDNFFEGFVAL